LDHFYPEMDKEADLASLITPIRDRIQGFFQSREKKRATRRVEGFHNADEKDWDRFTDNASRKSFVKELQKDPRSDPKLLRYADSMNRLKTGTQLGEVQGARGSYKIVKLRGSDTLGCSCSDWRYKKSVALPGESTDCKHIKAFKAQGQQKQASKSARERRLDRKAEKNKDYRPGQSSEIFHGSRTKIKKFEPRPHYLSKDEPAVFGTPERGMALSHLAYWTDDDFDQGRINNGPLTMRERKPGAFERIYGGKKGYLYKLAPESFDYDPRLMRSERISKESPQILETEEISDALKALEESDVRLVRMRKTAGKQTDAAEVTSTLRPHQERVLRKLETSDGILVAHRVGAGKTLTSIAAGVRSGLPMEVVTPASLTKNYEKELKKHVKGEVTARIRSYEKALRDVKNDEDFGGGGFIVLDEAHRLRNAGTQSSQLISPLVRSGKKRLLLTGTPIYNQPSDIAPLINLAAGKGVLPADPGGFNQKFIHEREVSPGLWQRLKGVEPGIVKELKNRDHLYAAMRNRVDLYDTPTDDYPAQEEERINVPMGMKQQQVYSTVMEQAPPHLRAKIRSGLPPSKAESSMMNMFTTAARQASLSPRPYVNDMTDEEELAETPKMKAAVERLKEMRAKDPNFRAVVYSNYLEAGIKPYARHLKEEGIPFKEFTGKVSKQEKAQRVLDFNTGKNPVLLVSSAGTEGLDLKGTKLVQVLEPHWNNAKVDQVIGRGVRYQSHSHLPPEERKVRVQRFYSTLQPTGLEKMFRSRPGMSAEEWIQQRADEKTQLGNQLRDVMAQATEKGADHVSQRIAERAPGTELEVAKLKMSLKGRQLRPGATYHVPLSRGRGYAVIGDVGGKHVVKTVLGPNMRPPGARMQNP
jgi:superfamily II DNA or RNA helicase